MHGAQHIFTIANVLGRRQGKQQERRFHRRFPFPHRASDKEG